MKIRERFSENYVMSFDPDNENDLALVEKLRKIVKLSNKISFVQKRVVLRGRKAIQKESRYLWGQWSTRSYDWSGNIVGGLKNAQRIDVYIYDR